MIDLARDLQNRLGLEYAPVGFRYADRAPPDARPFSSGKGCVAPLALSAARGTTWVLTREACGLPCAAYFLGFSASIFPGVERFLSYGPLPDCDCERFVRTPELAHDHLESVRFRAPAGKVAVLAPLESFGTERPEVIIVLANAHQLSALVFLLHHDASPNDHRVLTQFASACGSMITLPLRSTRQERPSAFWGLHDISARSRFPAHLMSLAMPPSVLEAAWRYAPDSFLATENWIRLRDRTPQPSTAPGGDQ